LHILFIVIAIIIAIPILTLCGLVAFYGKRHKDLLKKHPAFSAKHRDQYPPISFQYADAQDENLKKLREKYRLDAIAGGGPETERIINLMKWVYQLTSHTPKPTAPKELNALNLIDLCISEKKKLNCWMYSMILNEVYLSMAYPSRMIHLLPSSGEHKESHFVVSVYSADLGQWIMMDPDMCGYLCDKGGNLLNIPEIRRRMVTGETLVVNDDVGGLSRIFGKWSYTWYLSKNVFRYNCQQSSAFGQASQQDGLIFYELLPDGFREELLTEPKITLRGNKTFYINDESLFWQRPRDL